MERRRNTEKQEEDTEQGQELTNFAWIRGLIFWPWWIFSYLLQRVMGQCVRKYQKREDDSKPSSSENEKLKKKEIKKESCSKCANLESFQNEFEKLLIENEGLQSDLDKQQREIEELQNRIEQLQSDNAAIRESSNELTKKMATTLEKKSIFEDVSNPLAGMKLADRMNTIYDQEFDAIMEALEKILDDEIQGIRILRKFMVAAYKTCGEKAEGQIRQFLFLSDNEDVPSQQEFPELYKMRCIASIQEDKKKRVVQDIVMGVIEQIKKEEHILDTLESDTIDKLKHFLHKFTDCAWLMTVADKDQLVLNFDVLGQDYKGNLSKQFKQYASQDRVPGPTNTVAEVVWPSITMLNGQHLHAKGQVILATSELNDEIHVNGTLNGCEKGDDSTKGDTEGTEV